MKRESQLLALRPKISSISYDRITNSIDRLREFVRDKKKSDDKRNSSERSKAKSCTFGCHYWPFY